MNWNLNWEATIGKRRLSHEWFAVVHEISKHILTTVMRDNFFLILFIATALFGHSEEGKLTTCKETYYFVKWWLCTVMQFIQYVDHAHANMKIRQATEIASF